MIFCPRVHFVDMREQNRRNDIYMLQEEKKDSMHE